jgi:spore maturation protein CgeB
MRSLWQVAEQGPLDVVIVCHDFLWPDEVEELKRRTGASVAMWFPDHLANFGKGFFMNAPYDGLFFKDPYIIHVLKGLVASPVYYLPECFNPERHCLPEREVPGEEYHCDITTAGNSHSWRVAVYKHLADYDVKLWGNPPPLWMPTGPVEAMHQGRLVFNQDKARAFLGAKIVVNNLHFGEIWGLNVRAFEAAGIGAFQMIDWRSGLDQLFEDGKEIVSFRNMDDLRDKVDYWLNHPQERLAIADAGKRRAHAEHTYHLRLSLLLDSLAQRANGFPMPRSSN